VQCSLDCPYGAIEMVPRPGPREDLVARVDPSLCVSCGICSGSCAPMGVGPPGRTGRDQVADIRRFIRAPGSFDAPVTVVVIGCEHGAGAFAPAMAAAGATFRPVRCAGNLHSSVIEMVLRGGAAGVLVLSCPPRDCWNREGPRWLSERLYHGREAELQERVDRARVRVAYANASERASAVAALREFMADIAALERPVPPIGAALDVDTICERDEPLVQR
jgi:coenzyme F420-reducing hydrogenase delta subunit